MIKIQEVVSQGCRVCHMAQQVLEEIKPQFPNVEIEYIDMLTDKGQELVQKFGIMSAPGIIINGELFSMGGLDKDKLIAKLKSLSPA